MEDPGEKDDLFDEDRVASTKILDKVIGQSSVVLFLRLVIEREDHEVRYRQEDHKDQTEP